MAFTFPKFVFLLNGKEISLDSLIIISKLIKFFFFGKTYFAT